MFLTGFKCVLLCCTGRTNTPQLAEGVPAPPPKPPDTSLQWFAPEDQTDSHTRSSATAADSSDEPQTAETETDSLFNSSVVRTYFGSTLPEAFIFIYNIHCKSLYLCMYNYN